MEPNAPRSRLACEEDCKKQLEDCNPDRKDKTVCFDELKECVRSCEKEEE